MSDNRQKILDELAAQLKECKRLTTEEVENRFYGMRDKLILEIDRRFTAGELQNLSPKDLVKLLNVVQPCVERYEMMHGGVDTKADKEVMEIVLKVKPEDNSDNAA